MESYSPQSELATKKCVRPVLLLLFLVQGVLASLLFWTSSSCPLCILLSGLSRVTTYDALSEVNHNNLVSTFSNAGIYAMSSPPAPFLMRSGEDAFKPLYDPKFQNVAELLRISNTKLMLLWTSKEWQNKGQCVLALKEMGVDTSIGINQVASPPLVMKGDIDSLPFPDDTFDFEFSSVFGHVLFTSQFVTDIARTLKPGGCVVIHLMIKNSKVHKYNTFQTLDALIVLFEDFEIVHVGDIDAFGRQGTEVIFRKPCRSGWEV